MILTKILFITATYAPGKDGVADYITLLADKCAKAGVACAVLSWNDAQSGDKTTEEQLVSADNHLQVLRLPARLAEKEKLALGQAFIRKVQPSYVSIQMVCFGFHPRGWIFGLGSAFKQLIPAGMPIQIMFHELWLGMARNHPLKEKLYGFLQKNALKQFWTSLSPMVVHTSNNVYYSILRQYQLPVRLLPLPSNIPVVPSPDFSWLPQALGIPEEGRNKAWVYLFFGSLHGNWNLQLVTEKLIQLAAGRKVYFVSVGSQGNGAVVWQELLQLHEKNANFIKLGFQDDTKISALLQYADAGICTTPLSLLGKSGTAMAMIEHGIPVIVTRNELDFPGEIQKEEPPYASVFFWEQLSSLNFLQKQPPVSARGDSITSSFLRDLTNEN